MTNVLVVDDEPRIVSIISRALMAEGLGVDHVGDGIGALEMARGGRYHLIILDLLLPGKDGVAVLEEIIEARPQQRVLVLSALADVEQKVRCLELGASDYLHKPFALSELIARVRARLRQPASGPGDRYVELGGITLDLERRTAEAGSGQVHLSEREFHLIRHLMQQRGRVASRGELLLEVWGYPLDPGSNVVDVCVKRLRAKLGAQTIETVRNAGYRFNAP